MMGSVFAMQGIGQFAAGIMSLIVTSGFKESLLTADAVNECSGVCGIAVDKMWRVIIGFGAVPGCIALYYRLTIPETPRYTFDVSRDVVKAGSDVKAYLSSEPEGHPDEITRVAAMQDAAPRMEIPKASWSDFCSHYGQWKYGKVLLGTAGSWFFLDVAFYGVGLNNATILTAIGYAKGNSVYEIFYNISVGNLILVCAGAIPGYWVTVATVDTLGRKPIQLMGFVILTIMFCIMGFGKSRQWSIITPHNANNSTGYHQIGHNGLLACYVIAQFFFNFGPNSTTFIVPGECTSPYFKHHHLQPKTNKSQASPPATAPPPTVSPPPPVRSAPSSPKSSSDPSAPAAPLPPTRAPGSTTSWRSTLCSCCAASSPPFSSPRPSVRPSSNWPVRSPVLPNTTPDSRVACPASTTLRTRRRATRFTSRLFSLIEGLSEDDSFFLLLPLCL